MARWYAGLMFMVGVLHLAAAGGAEPGHTHAHDDDPLIGMVLVEELEWQNASPDDALAWGASAWLGHDTGRLLFRSEGEMVDGAVEDSRNELLWWRPATAWWDLVAGVRQDIGAGPERTYGLVGFKGTAPYRFHLEGDILAGERGQFGARLESDYEVLLTNRLILVPRAELQAYGKADPATGIGQGLSELELGLRLRYEIRREFAPYVGVEWSGALGDTADLAREEGEDVRDTRFLAGLRFWF